LSTSARSSTFTPWNVIDNPSRTLLAILTCWVIVRAAPNPAWLWRGITVGLFLALLIVGYQRLPWAMTGLRRGSGHRLWQHGGGAGLVGFARPGETRRTHAEAWFNVLCAVGILMLNGTRGAWWQCLRR
jgi:O-antigen ligase